MEKKEKKEKKKQTRNVKSGDKHDHKKNEKTTKPIDEIINGIIEGNDEKSDAFMSQFSQQAKEIREEISKVLDVEDKQTSNLNDQDNEIEEKILNANKQFEDTIKEKIADLQTTLKTTNTQNEQNKVVENLQNEKHSNEVEKQQECLTATACSLENVIVDEIAQNEKENQSEENNSEKTEINSCEIKTENNGNKIQDTHEDKNACKIDKKQVKMAKKVEQKEKAAIDQLTKQLSNYQSDSEKIEYLKGAYNMLMNTNKAQSLKIRQLEKIEHFMVKEKDHMQSEHNRVVLGKSRLENLCRELQRQNKAIKEESLLRIKEEEEKRKEIANKFQGTLNDIIQLIQENQKKNIQLKEEKSDLVQKLKALMNHYDNWEKHTEQVIKQKELESQLVKAKYAKTNILLNQEKEVYTKEKQQLIGIISELQKRCSDLAASELHLRTELSVYTTKYEEFQSVLSKSNETFTGFKKDIEKMSRQIKKLEKETANWKSKWEASNRALIALSEEVIYLFIFCLFNCNLILISETKKGFLFG